MDSQALPGNQLNQLNQDTLAIVQPTLTDNCQLSTANCQLPTHPRNTSDRQLLLTAQRPRNIKKLSCISSPSGEMICSAASRQFYRI